MVPRPPPNPTRKMTVASAGEKEVDPNQRAEILHRPIAQLRRLPHDATGGIFIIEISGMCQVIRGWPAPWIEWHSQSEYWCSATPAKPVVAEFPDYFEIEVHFAPRPTPEVIVGLESLPT